jgi:alpha-beta hydrolase superfamily lysophospholipase
MKSSNTLLTSDNPLTGTIVTADGHKISYTHFAQGNPGLILIAHGFYNSKQSAELKSLAENFLPEYDVFMFDFRGHGKSSGSFTWASKEGLDLEAVAGYLKGKYRKTGLIAFSFGGSISINALAKSRIADSLICVSAPAIIGKIDYHFWKLDWKGDFVYTLLSKKGRKGKGIRLGPFWLKKEDPVDNIAKIGIPVLFLHGQRDWVIKPWHSKALYEKATGHKRIAYFKNGAHAEYLLKSNRKEFLDEINRWFLETLKEEIS